MCSILPAPNIQAAKNLILFIPSQDAPVECQKILQEARVGLTEERPAKPKKTLGPQGLFLLKERVFFCPSGFFFSSSVGLPHRRGKRLQTNLHDFLESHRSNPVRLFVKKVTALAKTFARLLTLFTLQEKEGYQPSESRSRSRKPCLNFKVDLHSSPETTLSYLSIDHFLQII